MPTTKLTLEPQLRQLGALELDQYVQEAVEANPLLEFPSEVTGPAW